MISEKEFKKITKKNVCEVKKWPKWKQRIIISAESANTGRFIREKIK